MKISDMTAQELSGRLILSVANYNDSAERLLNLPYIRKGSFAALTQVCVGEKNLEGQYTACLTVTNDLMNGWNISKEDLFSMAVENSKRMFPVTVDPIERYLDSVDGKEAGDDDFDISKVSVLSNERFFNGAATIFYEPEVLDGIAESLSIESIYIMPSSVSHMYCMPADNGFTLDELNDVFKGLSGAIEENPRLCEHILVYDSASGTVHEPGGMSYDLSLTAGSDMVKKTHR